MQYDTIEELTLELALYPNKKMSLIEEYANKCKYGWFAIAKDGNCALFNRNCELDDISKIKSISKDMVPRDIENIIIPDSVTSIKDGAFSMCNILKHVTIGNNVDNIENSAFSGCRSLVSAVIPDSVIRIGDSAFGGCISMIDVKIGRNVKSIGWSVFNSCVNIASMTIPSSVKSIGDYSFSRCNKLKKLVFEGKTLEEVQSMENYPFGLEDESAIVADMKFAPPPIYQAINDMLKDEVLT